MPEKSQQKKKNDPKEQRKARQSRHQNKPNEKLEKKSPTDNKVERIVDEPKVMPSVKSEYEEPGPEFYKNLKRETDEILKITEEANSKYKKKEIKSNWAKYEMPIETYEEMDEQESVGADYEKLIQAPLSIGGHFQFKHEKSWSAEMEPSLYDKYFEINMDKLATALSTIPFYERNNIDKNIFNDIDILNMENRSTKYKQKYNDKTYTTPEMESQLKPEQKIQFQRDIENTNEKIIPSTEDVNVQIKTDLQEEFRLHFQNTTMLVSDKTETACNANTFSKSNIDKDVDDIDILLEGVQNISMGTKEPLVEEAEQPETIIENKSENMTSPEDELYNTTDAGKTISATEKKKVVIESPEDLEKWLDEYLDS